MRSPRRICALGFTIALVELLWMGALSSRVFAWDSLIPGSRYVSARYTAMGGAVLPLGDDGPSAIFINPAAAGRLKDVVKAEPGNFVLNATKGVTDNLGVNSYNLFSLSGNEAQLQASPGSFQGGFGQFTPTISGRGFAFGFLASDDFGAVSDSAGNIRYRTQYLLIPAFATGLRLAGGVVRIGYSLQWVNKASGDITAANGTSPLGYNQGLAQGSGFSHAVGAALTLPMTYLPEFDLVARNIGTTSYLNSTMLAIASNSPGVPANEAATFDVSFSLKPKLDSGIYTNIVTELRDMTTRSGVSAMGRLCGGLEIGVREAFVLRGGWGEGYPSAGAEFHLGKTDLGLSWYTEEIGGTYQGQGNTRFLLQLQLRAF